MLHFPLSLLLLAVLTLTACAEKPRSLFTVESPLELGEKRVQSPADGTTIEKFVIPSAAMNRRVHVVVVLPPDYAPHPPLTPPHPDQRFPVLYTLHGSEAPYDTFSYMAPLRAALRTHPMLVVGFDGDRFGWYLDSPVRRDSQFETFFFQELIPYIEQHYRAIPAPGARGVTGFSMGGFGAMHYMLVHPEMFASVSSLSGAFYLKLASSHIDNPPPGNTLATRADYQESGMIDLLGEPARHQADYDRLDIAPRLEAAVAANRKLPPLFLTCGTADPLLPQNRQMHDLLTRLKLPHEYLENPGKHDWPFWRDAAPAVIDFHWRSFQHP